MDSERPAPHQWRLSDTLIADARRAVWDEADRTLMVADVHLGYVWVERRRGALLPLVQEDAFSRLRDLLGSYAPRRCVFLGDTVHATAPIQALEEEFRREFAALAEVCPLEFVLGNHDGNLPDLLRRCGLDAPAARRLRCGSHALVHGDAMTVQAAREGDVGDEGWIIYGHEHPALNLSDGVTSGLRVPCFVVGHRRLILPAFSRWSAGQVVGRSSWLSPLSCADDPPHQFIAVVGDRLLPLPAHRERGRTGR